MLRMTTKARAPPHLTASMRALRAHDGGRPHADDRLDERKVQEAAEARAAHSTDQDLLRLAAKLERGCGLHDSPSRRNDPANLDARQAFSVGFSP